MANGENGFKITSLPPLKSMDDEDLFLVSDFQSEETNGKYHTRNLSVGQLMKSIADNSTISSAIVNNNTAIGIAVENKVQIALSNCLDMGGADSWN